MSASAADVVAPDTALAAALEKTATALESLAAAVDRLDRRLARVEADAAVIRGIADAWRQSDGRAAFPAPAGWVR